MRDLRDTYAWERECPDHVPAWLLADTDAAAEADARPTFAAPGFRAVLAQCRAALVAGALAAALVAGVFIVRVRGFG